MDEVTPDGGSGPSFRLIYRRRNLIPAGQRKAELGTLFSAARSNNKKGSRQAAGSCGYRAATPPDSPASTCRLVSSAMIS